MPAKVSPGKPGPSRSNELARRSTTDTVFPSSTRFRASEEPTLPHPTITTCTMLSSSPPGARDRELLRALPLRTVTGHRLPSTYVPIAQAARDRPSHRHCRRRSPAAQQEDRTPRLRQRRHLVHRIRHRRNPRRAARRGRDRLRRLHQAGPAVDRRRRAAGDRHHELPPDHPRLPERGRQLHREQGEPRGGPVAHRRLLAARRLHPHGRRVRGGRRARHSLCLRVQHAVDGADLSRCACC